MSDAARVGLNRSVDSRHTTERATRRRELVLAAPPAKHRAAKLGAIDAMQATAIS